MTDPAGSNSISSKVAESKATTSKPFWTLAIACSVCIFAVVMGWDLLPVWESVTRSSEIRTLVKRGEPWVSAEKKLREKGFETLYNPDPTTKLIQVTARKSRAAPWLLGQAYKILPAYRYRIARFKKDNLFDEYMRVKVDGFGNVEFVF